jgi:flagellar biosynthesis protein FliR
VIDVGPLAQFGVLLVRPGMLVATAPPFGGTTAPSQIKIGLAVFLTLMLMPLVQVPDVAGSVSLAIIVLREMAIGISLSLSIRALMAGAELAGSLTGTQVGLSMGAVMDPQSGVRNNLLAVLYANLALLTFLGLNGHHALIRALASSYETMPIGVGHVDPSIVKSVTELLALVLVVGVRLAMPIIVVMLVVELAMGLISRAAPMLNLMSVGMPVRLLIGLLVVAAVISVAPSLIARFMPIAMDISLRAARAFR